MLDLFFILFCAGIALIITSYICCLLITRYRTFTVQSQTPKEFGIEYDDFTVKGADNTKISCWFIPAQDCKAVMIVSHGVADGKSGLLHCTLGYYETKDLLLITDYVKEKLANGKPLCYWGFSLGATVSMLAAAKRKDIVGVVARSPFENIRNVVKHLSETL